MGNIERIYDQISSTYVVVGGNSLPRRIVLYWVFVNLNLS